LKTISDGLHDALTQLKYCRPNVVFYEEQVWAKVRIEGCPLPTGDLCVYSQVYVCKTTLDITELLNPNHYDVEFMTFN